MDTLSSKAISIPEVQDGIFGSFKFTVEEKAQMMLVSHEWATVLRPFLWHTFNDTLPGMQGKVRPVNRRDLVQNAHWIRHLTTTKPEVVQWLCNLTNRCCHLLTLVLVNVVGTSCDVWSLVRCNPRLQELTLIHVPWTELRSPEHDFAATQLKRLTIGDLVVSEKALKRVTKNWPWLELISMQNIFIKLDSEEDVPWVQGEQAWTGIKSLSLSPFQNTQHLEQPKRNLNRGLLDQCVNVENLVLAGEPLFFRELIMSVVETLELGNHSQISKLDVKSTLFSGLTDLEFRRLLEAIPRLKSLTLSDAPPGPLTWKTVFETKNLTLTSLELRGRNGPMGYLIRSCLTLCPGLISLKLDGPDDFGNSGGLENFEWTCLSLEELELKVDIVHNAQQGRQGVPQRQARVCDLFRQIANLKKLQSLKLVVNVEEMDDQMVSLEYYEPLGRNRNIQSFDICWRQYNFWKNCVVIWQSPHLNWCQATWPRATIQEYKRLEEYGVWREL